MEEFLSLRRKQHRKDFAEALGYTIGMDEKVRKLHRNIPIIAADEGKIEIKIDHGQKSHADLLFIDYKDDENAEVIAAVRLTDIQMVALQEEINKKVQDFKAANNIK